MNIAIIPARGGSKGIPRKNVRPVAGKPLIAWVIEAARGARFVDRVIVSTDDAEIQNVARAFGAEVFWRPMEISGDTASSESALLHVLAQLRDQEDCEPELTVFLQCTSPLTVSDDIDDTIKTLHDRRADTALTVSPFHYFLWQVDPSGEALAVNHDKRVRLRRQDREPQYVETGAVYVMKTAGFREVKHRFFGKTVMHVMPPERVLEIDEPMDLEIAEARLHARRRGQSARLLPPRIGAVVFDFDGVFTDNRVIVFENGSEAVTCNRGDGMGISLLKELQIPLLVLSTEQNAVVAARCHKVGIECLHGCRDKWPALVSWLQSMKLDPDSVVYLGNDINDVECLRRVGCGVVVGDAHPAARAVAKIVLRERGGNGAIRELADIVHDLETKVLCGS